jgi:hypothetical protein
MGLCCQRLAAAPQRFENLENPTEYVFAVPLDRIVKLLETRHGPNSWGPLGAGFNRGTYQMGVYDYYTKRYWTGKQERKEDVNPPEAGQIGTISATFEVQLAAKDDQHTAVSVSVKTFEQQVGRRYRMFPHFQKGPVLTKVKSDTYFEYLFLTMLGELLGEKNMPPLKGPAD